MKLQVEQKEYINLYRFYLDCKNLIEYKNKGESFEFMQEHILERMEANLEKYEDEK